jgi:hypothetical protein
VLQPTVPRRASSVITLRNQLLHMLVGVNPTMGVISIECKKKSFSPHVQASNVERFKHFVTEFVNLMTG